MLLSSENFVEQFPKLMTKYNVSTTYLAYRLGYSQQGIRNWTYEGNKTVPKQPIIDKINQIINGVKVNSGRK